jgi:dienelactone hydrolase
LADLGYIAFAADIFGADLQTNLTFDQRVNLTTSYRNDPLLFVQRMERAIEEVKTVKGVDLSKIAVIGYCFGEECGAGLQETLGCALLTGFFSFLNRWNWNH